MLLENLVELSALSNGGQKAHSMFPLRQGFCSINGLRLDRLENCDILISIRKAIFCIIIGEHKGRGHSPLFLCSREEYHFHTGGQNGKKNCVDKRWESASGGVFDLSLGRLLL